MTTKTISIMDDAYALLKSHKIGDESFSELIRRTFKKQDIMKFAGALKNTDTESIKNNIMQLKKKSTEELNEVPGF